MPTGIHMLMLWPGPLLPTIAPAIASGSRTIAATGSCAILLAIDAPATPATARAGRRVLFRGRLTSWAVNRAAWYSPSRSSRIRARSFLSPRLCAAASAHVGAWRVARRGRPAKRHGPGGQRYRASFIEPPAAVGVPIWANVAAAFVFFAFSSFAVYGG